MVRLSNTNVLKLNVIRKKIQEYLKTLWQKGPILRLKGIGTSKFCHKICQAKERKVNEKQEWFWGNKEIPIVTVILFL